MPTLVIGVTTSSGIGQNALSIISGSVGLDPGLMQMGQDIRTQDKSELIHPSVLKAIVKTLTIHFYQHNRVKPEVRQINNAFFILSFLSTSRFLMNPIDCSSLVYPTLFFSAFSLSVMVCLKAISVEFTTTR